MNTFILEASQWSWDYYLLATGLLGGVLVAMFLIRQPARRMAIAWSTAAALVGLALLCAVPDWSRWHVTNSPPKPQAIGIERKTDRGLLAETVAPVTEPVPLEPASAVSPTTVTTATIAARTKVESVDYGILVTMAIFAGSLLAAVWLVLGVWQVHRLCARAQKPSEELTALFAELASSGRLRLRLGIVDQLPLAAAVGLWRPMILLSESLVEVAPPTKLRSVLSHELAHVRHRDLWLLALMRGLMLLLWAHPLYWLWRRQVRIDQETLADAMAADVSSRADYAEQLVAWARLGAEGRAPRLASSVGLWESRSQLRRRIGILLDERMTFLRSCSRRWRCACVASLALAAVGLSLVTLKPESIAGDKLEPLQETAQDDKLSDKITLENGATISLLAIGTHNKKPQQWWDAQGHRLKSVPFEWVDDDRELPADERWYRVVARIDNQSNDAEMTWNVADGANYWGNMLLFEGKKARKKARAGYFRVADDQRMFGVKVGVASGPWRTVGVKRSIQKLGEAAGYAGKSAIISAATATSQGTAVVVSHNFFDQNFRIVAIDKQGKLHDSGHRGGVSAGGIYQSKATFSGLAIEGIERVEFQIRDYHWAEFRDLPLAMNLMRPPFPEPTDRSDQEAATSEPDQTNATTDEEPSIKTLHSGGAVELLAIGTHDQQPQRWWNRKGQLLETLPFEVRPATNISPQPDGQLVFRVHGLPEGAKVRWNTKPASNSSSGTIVLDGQEKPPGYYSHAFEFPKQQKTFMLRVGVASGKWSTAVTSKSGAHSRLTQKVVISDALWDQEGNTTVVVSHNITEADTRVVAVVKGDRDRVGIRRSMLSAGKQNQWRWVFAGLSPDMVRDFKLQVRPYEWVEFEGLPAMPGIDWRVLERKPPPAGRQPDK